jgi:hypothetical protein
MGDSHAAVPAMVGNGKKLKPMSDCSSLHQSIDLENALDQSQHSTQYEESSHHLSDPGLNYALQSDLCGSNQNAQYCGPATAILQSDGQSASIPSYPNFTQGPIRYGDVMQSGTDNLAHTVAFRHALQPSPLYSLPLPPTSNDSSVGELRPSQEHSPPDAQLHSIPQYAQTGFGLTPIRGEIQLLPPDAKFEGQHHLPNDHFLS